MDSDGFTVVKSGKRSSRKNVNTKIHSATNDEINSEVDIELTLMKIQTAMEDLRNTEFLSNIFHDLEKLEEEEGRIVRLYCFGLGQLSTVISRYQTAFLALLKNFLRIADNNTSVFDPIFTRSEKQVLSRLGFQVEEKNTNCRIKIELRSLVFLPHCPKELTNNLLYVNLQYTEINITDENCQESTKSLTDESSSERTNDKSKNDVKSSSDIIQKSAKSLGDEKSAKSLSCEESKNLSSASCLSTENNQNEKIFGRTLVTNLVLISNSISSTLVRTPATEIAKSANIIQIASEAGIVNEKPVLNTFKYSDIFNDLGLHTFTDPSLDLVEGIPQPSYTDLPSELIL